jgi:hypothetical protein
MLRQASTSLEPRCPRRWSLWSAGGLLTLAVFIAGVGFAAPVSSPTEETKKEEPKKDEPRKEKKKEEPRKEQANKDKPKKTDADKELDELVEEMTQHLPPGTDSAIAKSMRDQLRQNLRNMPAAQRKQMLEMMRRRDQRDLGAFPGPGNVPMPPGFVGSRFNVRLGAYVEPASATLVEQLELPKGQGLVVREVLPDSASARAGLKPHDVLLQFNGKSVPNRVEEFVRLMADIKADAVVEVVVLRKGKKETIKDVKLPEAKAIPPGGLPAVPRDLPPGGLPQPPGAFHPPGIGDAGSVVTTIIRTPERFTLRHQEGSLIITLTGKTVDGKPKMKEIQVQDRGRPELYDSVDKVPERYQEKVKHLIELSEKSSVKSENKSP